MLDQLKVFITAAEQRSLTGAAETLDMTLATVSRRVSDLEHQLGAELFHRSNRGLSLTSAGQTYYDETAGYIHELDLRLRHLDQSLNQLEGELRILAPTNLGSGPLDDFWQAFIGRYPGISLNITLGDPEDDAIAPQADLAIRSGPQQNSSLKQLKLGAISTVLVVSPSAPQPVPSSLEELASYPSIAAHLFNRWTLQKTQQSKTISKEHQHISNDMNVTLNLVKAGAGIALLPQSMVYRELSEGSLQRVLPDWSGQARNIFLLWPYRRTLSARALVFRDELMAYLAQQPWFSAS
ncbi:LysR family transcriptional regulator [Gilvimarinus xylanilyticus]|uniref:LysR family transcriptional regulator n=1 Tax=Gilvimarinus xylanilyticus TaxID=2944139 RepID=A0A9X2HZZ1_9GAMM|nr:LysR family transcriptional regulator [Gilvimarinus xylanilyticus]MCP8897785.1 LysR family transcriptional regulator [Gilvimarinus xylanilyticus]